MGRRFPSFIAKRPVCSFFRQPACRPSREFEQQPGEQAAVNELIVRLRPGTTAATVLASIAPGSQVDSLPDLNVHRIKIANRIAAEVSRQLANHPLVDFVEPNRIRRRTAALPSLNDPNAGLQWALHGP